MVKVQKKVVTELHTEKAKYELMIHRSLLRQINLRITDVTEYLIMFYY